VRYLRVKNWAEFQHYKDRNPPWIKLHRALLDDYEFSRLQDASKAHLVLIWLFASQKDGAIPEDPAFLKKKLGLKQEPNLKLFIDHGLLIVEQDASRVLAGSKQSAPLEESYKASDKTTEEVAVLPSWLPMESWKAWLEVRRKNKAPNTPHALNLAISELTRLRSLGFDAAQIIDQSVLHGWKAFYPLKEGAALKEPAGKLCDYCTAVSSGTVNGRRACGEHWSMAMDNERPVAKTPPTVVVDMKLRSAGG
jgi:hypothetical protein